MIKITDMEALLNLPYEGTIELEKIEYTNIVELSRYFGTKIEASTFRRFSTFKRNEMSVILWTPVALGDCPFPEVDLEFLNIKK